MGGVAVRCLLLMTTQRCGDLVEQFSPHSMPTVGGKLHARTRNLNGRSNAGRTSHLARWRVGAGGATQAEIQHQFGDSASNLVVRNVTRPTITPFLPEPSKATGAAVVIAPGGGFMMLSVNSEGTDVARWLASRGVAAFVLKYRLQSTPANSIAFRLHLVAALTGLSRFKGSELAQRLLSDNEAALEDAKQAVRLIRERAAQWRIDPTRVGALGFSAGAFAVSAALFADDRSARPDFAGLIYGGTVPEGAVPSKETSPCFVAVSNDDGLLFETSWDLALRLRSAGVPLEFHLYRRGGHGYGVNVQGMSSDHWIDQFYWWLQDLGVQRN